MKDVFGYDSFWQILVCKHGPQAHGVRPSKDEVKRHLREHHDITIPVEQQTYIDYFSSLRCRTRVELEAFLDSFDQPARPVDYIETSPGFHCPDCDYLTAQQRPRHKLGSRCVSKNWQPCRLQKFFPGLGEQWFRVDINLRIPDSPPSDLLSDLPPVLSQPAPSGPSRTSSRDREQEQEDGEDGEDEEDDHIDEESERTGTDDEDEDTDD